MAHDFKPTTVNETTTIHRDYECELTDQIFVVVSGYGWKVILVMYVGRLPVFVVCPLEMLHKDQTVLGRWLVYVNGW